MTLDKLKGKHDSIPRNPLIAKAFFWIKFAEDVGSGTSKIVQWCKEWGLPEPTYEEAGGSFVTVFHNPKQDESIQISSEKHSEISSEKHSEKIIAAIKENPTISAQQIAQAIGITSRAIEKHLSNLKNKGVLKRVGPDRGGHWEIQK
ncbi:MAG: winged helix-turn-helix transcriptional regulator [Candidatus Omnitrophota bacterium]|nr:winged helix-turn-helix transcriptional regulator [Candidatus Omnitrophota bacterium]